MNEKQNSSGRSPDSPPSSYLLRIVASSETEKMMAKRLLYTWRDLLIEDIRRSAGNGTSDTSNSHICRRYSQTSTYPTPYATGERFSSHTISEPHRCRRAHPMSVSLELKDQVRSKERLSKDAACACILPNQRRDDRRPLSDEPDRAHLTVAVAAEVHVFLSGRCF